MVIYTKIQTDSCYKAGNKEKDLVNFRISWIQKFRDFDNIRRTKEKKKTDDRKQSLQYLGQ